MNDVADGFRITATDLMDAQRRSARHRAASPTIPILLDIEVLIDRDTRSAFDALENAPKRGGLRYVGTPRGLAGLIADVQRLGIADGVVLKPLTDSPVADLMLEELVPGLSARQLR
ncbi:hypothetical protein LTT02_16555 [Mycolicibacterium smegmatis]|uniref:hypothetical protein n=1 Tax=Mycolicibacterium smegmatis TaxID=1772 RepID=UPI0005D79AC0|nr:hypothetical protein [Mycolicibacterium smegmatis]MDF1898067.1 hypothetical protein [Mycolicibacterium smegmatis]MDF1904906.1 hypothetical protein [Mycolicibacterium smegmatis]MDF1916826.1 hypothetical protein [Mycolicibacterium smegmatis]MDF1923240.1 hypothetical protein [Mycolicibacterium smegmatis]UAK52790.1 hypothetical protein K8P01_19315 [Mycolicibacterium smegmatis]